MPRTTAGRPPGYWINREAWADLTTAKGLSIPTVAERGGIKPQTLRPIVTGHDRASLEMAHRIADGAGVHVETLFPSIGHRFEQVDPPKAA